MIYYSRYRRNKISENAKAIICAVVISLCWCAVSEMDYREATKVEVCK